jgi:hypothetical protein
MSRLSVRFAAPLAVALITSAAFAQAPAAATHATAAPAIAAHASATPAKSTASAPAMKTPAKAAKPAKSHATSNSIVAHTTKTGKTVNYDCSKAGNKTKTACKK